MTDNNNKKAAYYDVTIEGSKDTYQIELLNLRAKRDLMVKVTSLITPALGGGAELFLEVENHKKHTELAEEGGYQYPEETPSIFPLAAIVGSQLNDPAILEVMDELMKNTRKNGLPYDPEEEHSDEEFARYTKLIRKSFEVNIQGPLVRCLNEMGCSEIVGLVQTMATTYMEKHFNDSKDS